MLDKTSNNIMYAVLGFGGFLGMGEKYHPIPWSLLDYSKDMGGYVVPMSKDTLQRAPAYDLDDLVSSDGDIRSKSFTYYKVPPYWG